jgi:hypothetical protein
MNAGDGILGRGSARSLVQDSEMKAASVEISLQRIGIRLARGKSIPGGDTVAVTDQ